jgi:hypothetical protein
MEEDSAEHLIRQYIATGAAEGAMTAARELSKTLEVSLDEVLAAVRRAIEPAAALAGTGSLTVAAGAATARGVATAHGSVLTVAVAAEDYITMTEGLPVIRPAEVAEVTRQASRGGLARLSANQRILAAVLLIAAIYPLLPPEVQEWLNKEPGIAAAIAAVLVLIKRQ